MSAASYDILANGLLDKHITGTPTTTFWRSTWKRHTRFAVENLTQPFNTNVAFGSEAQVILNRAGDMVNALYLQVKLPGIVACDAEDNGCAGLVSTSRYPHVGQHSCKAADEAALVEHLSANFDTMTSEEQVAELNRAKADYRKKYYSAGTDLDCCSPEDDEDEIGQTCPEMGSLWAHWVNDTGHFMINKAKLIIGGQTVDTLSGTFLFAWEELSGKSGRRLTELTGRRYTRSQLLCDSREMRILYVPLPFWFTLNSGSALPLTALAYHGVQLNVEFARLEELIIVSNKDVVVKNTVTGNVITSNDLNVELDVSYVYLDTTERDKFQSAHFEQLIVQNQSYTKTDNKEICRIGLNFNHPVLELIFAVRRQCHAKSNNWSNFSGVDGRDPISHAELLLNTTARFQKKPALFWRGLQPYEHHANIPDTFIYVMSFALKPEDTNPSGSCNFSRIDNIELVLYMQPALANESYAAIVFARSWNLMRYREGVAGAAFQ